MKARLMKARLMKARLTKVRLVLGLCIAAAPAWGQGGKIGNVDPLTPAAPGPVAALFLAEELFRAGLAARDPLALIESARLQGRIALAPLEAPEPDAGGKALKGTPPAPRPLPDPAATLDTAAALAEGDDTLLTLIDETRGAEPAPQATLRSLGSALAGGGSESWTLTFFGAAPAEVGVLAGDSVLAISVADEKGTVICAATAPRLYCPFTPLKNGPFSVTVANPGTGVEAYRLITN
jgi:hypothetical protein